MAFQIPASCVYAEAKCQECCCGSSGWKIQRKQIHLYHTAATKQCSLVSSWLKCCRFTLVIPSIVLAAVEHSTWHLCTFPLSDWMLGMFWNGRRNVALLLQGLTSCPCAPGDGIVGRAGVHRPFWNRINTLRWLCYMMWHCFSFFERLFTLAFVSGCFSGCCLLLPPVRGALRRGETVWAQRTAVPTLAQFVCKSALISACFLSHGNCWSVQTVILYL